VGRTFDRRTAPRFVHTLPYHLWSAVQVSFICFILSLEFYKCDAHANVISHHNRSNSFIIPSLPSMSPSPSTTPSQRPSPKPSTIASVHPTKCTDDAHYYSPINHEFGCELYSITDSTGDVDCSMWGALLTDAQLQDVFTSCPITCGVPCR